MFAADPTTNDDLVDSLLARNVLHSPAIASAFRRVPRALFAPQNIEPGVAYADRPLKVNNLHLSAPHIYAMLLEAFEVDAGMSFLNVGSGSGYLSAIVGLLLGPEGVNHGIEVCEENVRSSKEAWTRWREEGLLSDGACEAEFVQGSCYQLDPLARTYDRVYVGASCPTTRKSFFRSFLNDGGIAVMPCDTSFLLIRRSGVDFFEKTLAQVSFAPLNEEPSYGPPPAFETPAGPSAPSCGPNTCAALGYATLGGFRHALELELRVGERGEVEGAGTCDSAGRAVLAGSLEQQGPRVWALRAALEVQGVRDAFHLTGYRDPDTGEVFATMDADRGAFWLRPLRPARSQRSSSRPPSEDESVEVDVAVQETGAVVHLRVAATQTVESVVQCACEKAGIEAEGRVMTFGLVEMSPEATLRDHNVYTGCTLRLEKTP
eukprot:m51a1_g3199 hypothetical protein (433) ;mRNA; f:457891-459470